MMRRAFAPALGLLLTSLACAGGCRGDGTPPHPSPQDPIGARPDAGTLLGDPVVEIDASGKRRNNAPIGTNLGLMSDYSGEWPFVDAFKTSRPWISGTRATWDDQRPLLLDAHGWVRELAPDQLARTLFFFRDGGMDYPGGRYVVRWKGKGRLEVFNAQQVEAGDNRLVIQAAPPNGFGLLLTATDPSDYVREIEVLMPGGSCAGDPQRYCVEAAQCPDARCVPFEQTASAQPFHPLFLARIASYRAIRFMDWMQTNGSRQTTFDGRPAPGEARYTARGVPLEVMIDLANRLYADPWFTLPHRADADYIRRFAQVVKEQLRPTLRVYVEHSNEVWNGIFEQSRYAQQAGQALGLSNNAFEAQLRWHADRSLLVFRTFSEVFGDPARVVRVMGSMAANPWVSGTLLGWHDASKETDALAIAPYFAFELGQPERAGWTTRASDDEVFKYLEQTALPEIARGVRAQAEIAKMADVRLIAYEGGQHMVGGGAMMQDQALTDRLIALNRSPRMKAAYLRYLDDWRQAGGEIFFHYVACQAPSRYGSWGALESLSQPRAEAPKHDALMEVIEQHPNGW